MKKIMTIIALFLSVACFAACDDGVVEAPVAELRTEAVCDDGVPAYDVSIERHVTGIGPSSNDMASTDEALFIVESGSNTVSRFDRRDHDFHSGFIDVQNERNPYAIAIDEQAGEVWIVNYLKNSVTIADLETGAIVAELEDDGFRNPSAIALSDDYAYVANVDYQGQSAGYGPGTVAVVDRQTREVVSVLETEFKNPHFLALYEIDDQQALFASGAGGLQMEGSDVWVTDEGGLEWFDLSEDAVAPPSETFSLGQADVETVGAPGRPLLRPDGDRLYFSSAIAPVLFVFDLEQRTWIYNAADPLVLYEADGAATHRAAMGADGLLWISAFNDDALYLFDTACDQLVAPAIELGTVANMLEGPQALTVIDDSDGFEGFYLMSIANALGRVVLDGR